MKRRVKRKQASYREAFGKFLKIGQDPKDESCPT